MIWVRKIAMAAVLLFMGVMVTGAGYSNVSKWEAISPWFAACVALWMVAGPVMAVAALWILLPLGRKRIPLLAGGAAGVLAGAVLFIGVLTAVVPCSGPS